MYVDRFHCSELWPGCTHNAYRNLLPSDVQVQGLRPLHATAGAHRSSPLIDPAQRKVLAIAVRTAFSIQCSVVDNDIREFRLVLSTN